MIIDSKLRIFPTHKSGTAIHFLISDSTGESAIIEFIDGKMISYTGSQMPVRVLANNTYEESMDLWEKNRDATYYNRFIIAARHLEKYEHQNLDTSAENAFSILDDVSQKRYTKWSIVYDIKNLMVSYRTGSNRGIRHVDLKRIDFSCNTPVQVLDINEIKEGEAMDKFTPYSFIKNSNLIMESFKATYKGAFDTNGFQDMLKRIAKYPDTITCK